MPGGANVRPGVALAISSWALVFLSAPMMAAYGQVHGVPLIFYLQIALVYLPFVIIPALFGSWLILFLVRVLARPGVQNALLSLAVVSDRVGSRSNRTQVVGR